jgi:translation initiation factor 2 subunit 1
MSLIIPCLSFVCAVDCSEDGTEDIFDGLNVAPEIKEDILTYVRRKLAPQSIKIRADIEVTCFTYEGIDVIKEALMAGERKGTSENPIKIKLIAPPLYVITCTTLDKDFGIQLLNEAIETITSTARTLGGAVEVKMPPKAVTQREDADLQAMLDRLAIAQDDVDGDDEPDDEGDM